MRKDMSKVVSDKTFRGTRMDPKGEKRKKNWEKKNEAVRPRWRRSYCGRTVPLYRFLQSKVGGKWDDIYSEICKEMSQDSLTQKYVRDHVFDFVELNCFEHNGQVYDSSMCALGGSRRWHSLYVNEDGILCKIHYTRKKYIRPKPKFFPGICPLQYKGIWYEVNLVAFITLGSGIRDQFLGLTTEAYLLENFYGSRLYCNRKRQMNKSEIKRLT